MTSKPWSHTTCAPTAIRRADRAISRLYDDALRPVNLTITQYSLLSTLSRAPADLSLRDLAEAQVMDRTTLTRALAPLLRDDLVAITPGTDRRTKHVAITDHGHQRISEARPLWRAAQDGVVTEMGSGWIERLMDDLGDLVSHVRPTPDSTIVTTDHSSDIPKDHSA